MNLRAVGRREQDPDLVGRPVKLSAALGRRAMEDIDQSPGDLLGVLFQRRVREQGEKVRPNRGERLLDGVGFRKVGGVGLIGSVDGEMTELELGELRREGRMHIVSPV